MLLKAKGMHMDEKLDKKMEDFGKRMMGMWQSAFQGMANHFGVAQGGFATATTAAAAAATTTTTTTTTARMGTTQQTSPASTIPLLTPAIQNFRFVSQHNNLKGLWDEWHGLGEFDNQPVAGGVAKLEELYGTKWRPKSVQQRVSRQGRICAGIKKKAEGETKTIDEVCNQLHEKYTIELNRNMRRFVEYLQQEGWIAVHARRQRSSNN